MSSTDSSHIAVMGYNSHYVWGSFIHKYDTREYKEELHSAEIKAWLLEISSRKCSQASRKAVDQVVKEIRKECSNGM